VALSGVAKTRSIRYRFEVHGPWHVVVLMRDQAETVTALGSAEFEAREAKADSFDVVL
jgi:hypothetical protein